MDKLTLTPTEISKFYEMFASFFLKPTTTKNLKEFLSIVNELDNNFPLSNMKTVTLEFMDNLDIEQTYYDHFFIPTTKNYIPPYESAIIGALSNSRQSNKVKEYGKLWTYLTEHVAECYTMVDFNPILLDIDEFLKNPLIPDHIGLELAFVAYLSINMENCDENNKNINWYSLKKQFLEEHLTIFITAYISIANNKFNPFYSQLLHVVNDFIKWDLKNIKYRI